METIFPIRLGIVFINGWQKWWIIFKFWLSSHPLLLASTWLEACQARRAPLMAGLTYCTNRVSTAQGKYEKWPKKYQQGKPMEFVEMPKTQGKNILAMAVMTQGLSRGCIGNLAAYKFWPCIMPISVTWYEQYDTVWWLSWKKCEGSQGNLSWDRENTGNLKVKFKWSSW